MSPQAREEIQMLTEMAYMPVALKNKRYNGMDFLEVAFQLKSELLRQNPSIDMEEAAMVMLETFNSKLNPKMSRGGYGRNGKNDFKVQLILCYVEVCPGVLIYSVSLC